MASLADSAVTLIDSYTDGGISSKRQVEGFYDLVLTGQGGLTNKILASNLGLTKVERCNSARLSDNSIIYGSAPSYDGSFIILADVAAGTPVDVTGTIRIFVAGYR